MHWSHFCPVTPLLHLHWPVLRSHLVLSEEVVQSQGVQPWETNRDKKRDKVSQKDLK